MNQTNTNNFGELKQTIMHFLKDNEIHTTDEILLYINNALKPRVISKSHFYTAISQLIKHNVPIEKLENGTYRLKEEEPSIIHNAQSFLIKQLTACNEYLQKQLCFDLSSSEYLSLKEYHMKIQHLINEL